MRPYAEFNWTGFLLGICAVQLLALISVETYIYVQGRSLDVQNTNTEQKEAPSK